MFSEKDSLLSITTPRFLALGDEVTVASPSEMEKSEKGEVRAGKKISSALPGLSFRWWLSIQLWMSLRQAEIRLETCVFWRGKGEKELGIVRIAVVRHAMHGNDSTKRPSVQREEEGTKDWALRDSSNKGTRGWCITSPGNLRGATREVGLDPV